MFSRNGGTSTSGCWRLGESLAALSTLMLGGFTFQAPLLSLFAAGDAVGAREIGGAQMKKNRQMSSCVTGTKCPVRIVELAAAMGAKRPDSQCIQLSKAVQASLALAELVSAKASKRASNREATSQLNPGCDHLQGTQWRLGLSLLCAVGEPPSQQPSREKYARYAFP